MRRGMAYKGLKLFDKAKRDLEQVINMEPNNKKAKVFISPLCVDFYCNSQSF